MNWLSIRKASFVVLLLGASALGSCSFPDLTRPEVYFFYRQFFQDARTTQNSSPTPTDPIPSEPIPNEPLPSEPTPTEPIPTEPVPPAFSANMEVTYNSVVYNPTQRIDLGIQDENVPVTYSLSIRNTSNQDVRYNTTTPYTTVTTSTGSFNLTPTSTIPEIWASGVSYDFNLTITPNNATENLWRFRFHITEPQIATIEYDFAVFVRSYIRNDLLFFSANHTTDTNYDGIFKYRFDRTAGLLSPEGKVYQGLGGLCGAHRIALSSNRRYLFHTTPIQTDLSALKIHSDTSLEPIVGYPQPMITYGNLINLPDKNKLFIYRDTLGGMTYDINPYTGLVFNQQTFGMVCVSNRIWASADGNHIIGGPIDTRDLVVYSNVEGGGFQQVYLNTDGDAQNRLRIHLKSLTRPYIYSVTHTATPGTDNLRVDAIVRRPVNVSGVPLNSDSFLTFNAEGASYTNFLAHPNDNFYYLVGAIGTTQAVIHFVHHDPSTDTLTPDTEALKPSGVRSFGSSRISPDGKYLIALAFMSTAGSCGTVTNHKELQLYEINQTTGVLALKTAITHCASSGNLEWAYSP